VYGLSIYLLYPSTIFLVIIFYRIVYFLISILTISIVFHGELLLLSSLSKQYSFFPGFLFDYFTYIIYWLNFLAISVNFFQNN
jgi:hypothetical protein